MRNQKERFATFPFSAICVSQSSIEVIENHLKKLQAKLNPTQTDEGEIQSKRRTKSSFLPLREAFKTFKGLSHVFQSYEEDDDNDEESEMVIGLPTDVQHVAHIGWDGFNSWDKGQELALPTISLKQFELAMAAS